MIIDKFEEQVKKYPNHLAVKTGDIAFSYQELNNYANAVAQKLLNKHHSDALNNQETVVLLFEHGNDMIAGTIGALKAGNVYVPLDPSYPPQLLKYILKNCEGSIIITNDKNMELANMLIQEANSKTKVINISEINVTDFFENINVKCKGSDLAYILYTSGSTGRPKGVMQSHENVLHFSSCYSSAIELNPEDKMILLSSFSHDAAIVDIYSALLNGAALYPLDIKANTGMNKLADWLKAEQISIWHSVPTLYRHFMNTINEGDDFPSFRFIVLGGERVLLNDINRYSQIFPFAKFAIIYGQSESSINSMQIYTVDSKIEEINLGEPVPETEILVVDENREEVLPLEIGEIVILSNHVALGYWKEEKRNDEVFGKSGAVKTYWTGDLGKLLLDGSIEFFGRKDFQVKLRGLRIELGGIENWLLEHHAVKEAIVIVRKDTSDDDYLCAYIVADKNITTSELREYLLDNLPEYMVPTYFVHLEKMPLTPNGKIDRKALPEPVGVRMEYVAPRNKTEEVLAQIWCEILGHKRIGINDNFFELGGHSLKAFRAVNKMNVEFNVNIPLLELYDRPSISRIVEYINEAKDEFEKVDCLSLLKKGKQDSKNLFMIHAGQGKAAVYLKLVNNMNSEFNYWGISYEETAFYDPYIIPLEKLVTRYIEKIKRIQEKGPYYISGWCIGGTIAFEMAKQLEAAGDEIGFVGLYNAPVSDKKESKKFSSEPKFEIKAEHDLVQKLFPEYHFSKTYEDITSFVDLWDRITKDLERAGSRDEAIKEKIYNRICLESPRIKRVVKSYEAIETNDLLHYFNSLRVLSNVFWRYIPKGRIKTPIHYFVAAKEERENKILWTKRSKEKVDFHYIDVDHFTMFVDDEDVKKLAATLTSILDQI